MSKKLVAAGVTLVLLVGAYLAFAPDPPVAPGAVDAPGPGADPETEPETAAMEVARLTAPDSGVDRSAVEPAPTEGARGGDPLATGPGSLLVRVRQSSGAPAAGVEIYVKRSAEGHSWSGLARRHTDEAGEVFVEGIPPSTVRVGPLRDFYHNHRDVTVEAGARALVELTLEPGVTVRGEVLDENGLPVAGAVIWVATGMRHGLGGEEVARSDDFGAFVLESVDEGTGVGAIAAGHERSNLVDLYRVVKTNGVAEVELRLPARAGAVTGRVVDPEGAPVEGAVVRAYDRELDPSFVQGGQFDYYSAFGFGIARTDASGGYRIDHLQLVPTHMYATPAPRRNAGFGDAVIRDQTVVQGTEGEVVRWDPTLAEGLVVHGRVTYSDGVPMEGVFVTARHEDSGTSYVNVSGPDGAFRFTNMEQGAHALGVQVWDPPEGAKPVAASGVYPGPDPVLLVAEYPAPVEQEPGSVTGRIVDEGRRLEDLSQLRVILRYQRNFSWREGPTHDGTRSTFDEVEPGEYRVCAFSGDTLLYQGGWFELEPGEVKDLGHLRTEPGGTILLTVDRSALPESARPSFRTGKKDVIDSDPIEVGREVPFRIENLDPGVHLISGGGEGVARVEEEVLVVAGEETAVTLVLQPAVRRDFSVDWPPDAELEYLRTRIVSEDGTEVWDLKERNVGALPRPYERWTRLPVGDFVLTAETGREITGSVELSVTDLEAEQEVVRLTLR